MARARLSCSDELSIHRKTALRVVSHFRPTLRLGSSPRFKRSYTVSVETVSSLAVIPTSSTSPVLCVRAGERDACFFGLFTAKEFQSILGYYWYLRLRGHEIDAIDFKRKSFGNTYALGKQTNDPRELAKLLMKLCEKTGRRLRRAKYSAQGVSVYCVYTDLSWWHISRKFDLPVYTTRDIYIKALRLLNSSGYKKTVRNLAVSVYDLIPSTSEQLELFASPTHKVAEALDKINDRWGEFVVIPALMMGMGDIILDRISFGGVKELEEIYFD
jgi:impB/mucB/samB family C-terminal domain